MAAGRLLLGPNAAPPAPDPSETGRNRPPRSAVPGYRPWPTVASAARQRRKSQAVPPFPIPRVPQPHGISDHPERPAVFGSLQLLDIAQGYEKLSRSVEQLLLHYRSRLG